MGKAVVLNNIDFSETNLGKVVFTDANSNVPVTSIQTDTDKSTFKVGESATIIATVSPSGATNSNVRWSTSSNAIASITSTGNTCMVTGLATGTVTITCTSESNSSIRSTEVLTVTDILLTNLVINGSTGVTNNGKYTVSYLPANTTQTGVNWSTSNSNIATIDSSGNLTVVSNGVVTVTATSTKNNAIVGTLDVTCQLSVIAVSGITLSAVGNPTTLNIGNSLTINAAVLPDEASNKAITWSVNNNNVSITSLNNEQCTISGLTAGNVTITATSNANSGITASYNLTVQFVYITGITVTSTSETLRVGNSVVLSATMYPSNATDKAVTWTINNTGATISQNADSCTVNAVSEGEITVTATAADGSNIAGSWTTTILAALEVDTTLKVHLEAEDYVESSNVWTDRASNIQGFVYGSPAKSVSGLTFETLANAHRYCVDVSNIYSGGSFTVFVKGYFSFNSSASPTRYIAGIQAESGDADNGFWLATRGTGVGTVVLATGGGIKSINKMSANKAVMTFNATTNQIVLYGIDSSGVIFTKSDTISEASVPLLGAFKTSVNHYLTNGSVISFDPAVVLSSTNNITNKHTIKTIKMYNVVKSVEEITAMLNETV